MRPAGEGINTLELNRINPGRIPKSRPGGESFIPALAAGGAAVHRVAGRAGRGRPGVAIINPAIALKEVLPQARLLGVAAGAPWAPLQGVGCVSGFIA